MIFYIHKTDHITTATKFSYHSTAVLNNNKIQTLAVPHYWTWTHPRIYSITPTRGKTRPKRIFTKTYLLDRWFQSVSWSGAWEYQAGCFPIVLRSLVKGDSGIRAFSSSSSSSWVFGSPSGTGKGLCFSSFAFAGVGFCRSLFFFFRRAVSPCKQSIRVFLPPACLTSFSTSSLGSSSSRSFSSK